MQLRRVAPCLLCGVTKKIYLPDAPSADNVVDIVLTAMVVRLCIPANVVFSAAVFKHARAVQLLPLIAPLLPETVHSAVCIALEATKNSKHGNRFKRISSEHINTASPLAVSSEISHSKSASELASPSRVVSETKGLWQTYRNFLSPQAFAAAAQRSADEIVGSLSVSNSSSLCDRTIDQDFEVERVGGNNADKQLPYVFITPLSHVAGSKIIKYLGPVRFGESLSDFIICLQYSAS